MDPEARPDQRRAGQSRRKLFETDLHPGDRQLLRRS
jgi:hypothetical protein